MDTEVTADEIATLRRSQDLLHKWAALYALGVTVPVGNRRAKAVICELGEETIAQLDAELVAQSIVEATKKGVV